MRLFAYGSLMCADILAEVIGLTLAGRAGRVRGFGRKCVRNEHYPALVPGGNAVVEGVLYDRVTEPAWIRLDEFEGEMYQRRDVEVWLEGGTRVAAQTYVIRSDYLHWVSEDEWDYEQFLRNGIGPFRRAYLG